MPSTTPSPTGDGRTYLSFEVAGEGYALALEMVREIVRVPPLVRVPQSPDSLEGLGNLRGRVLPVVSVGGLLRKPPQPQTASARVLVLDRGALLGLSVDGVGALLSVGEDQIDADGEEGTPTVLRVDGGDLRVIDPETLLAADFKPQPRAMRSRSVLPVAESGADGRAAAGQIGLIGFELAGQEFALPLDSVQEVLPLPPDLTALPGDDGAAIGVATFRGRMLPVLSGPALLGLPAGGRPDGRARIIVIPLGKVSFGLLVDRTTAIYRTDAASLDAVPAILSRGPRPEAEVQAIARVEGRLVAILSPEWLLSRDRMEQVMASGDGEDEAKGPVSNEVRARQFVLFRLGETEYAVSIDVAEEVARVPDQLPSLPGTPAYVKGVMTLRGRALPVIDLRGRLDLPPVPPTGQERVLILSSKGKRAGFLVDRVSEVVRLPDSAIEPAPELADGRATVVALAANLAEAGRLILLIDGNRLLDGSDMMVREQPAS